MKNEVETVEGLKKENMRLRTLLDSVQKSHFRLSKDFSKLREALLASKKGGAK